MAPLLEGFSVARTARPWFWGERGGWYVIVSGQRQFLGEHPSDAPPPRKIKKKWNVPPAIKMAFHALMAAPVGATAPAPAPKVELTVAELLDKFLDWCGNNLAESTFAGHQFRIQAFIRECPEVALLPATGLRPFHVIEWVEKHQDWSSSWRRNCIMSIQRPYNWAEELGHISASPIRKIKKPEAGRREQVVTPNQWAAIHAHYPAHDPFIDLLEFCWETASRPQEARSIEIRHLRLDQKCVAFPPKEAKGKKRWRIIRLTPTAIEILKRRAGERAEGTVFLNANGDPWTAYAMNCRFCRLKKHTGIKHFAYAWRHSFATRKLIEGHDHLTVAEIMGHRDGTMLARVYAHLDQDDEHLRKALG